MGLNIKNEETRRGNLKRDLVECILEIGRDCAARLQEPFKSMDHGDLLYNEQGLPK